MARKKFPPLVLGDLPIERCPFFMYKNDSKAIEMFSPLWETLKGAKDVSMALHTHYDHNKGYGDITFRFGYSEEQRILSFKYAESIRVKALELGFFPVLIDDSSNKQLRIQIWESEQSATAGAQVKAFLRKGGKESRWDD